MPVFVTVTVRQGALKGRRCKTPSGNHYLSFQGVPYAQPPVGDLRFKSPQPPEPWTGIRDATKDGNQCLQFDPFTKQYIGEEDCLFLNILTPNLPTGLRGDKLRAVLVWIHGGGFANGSINMYGTEPFMDHDIVIVSINYRLGPMGFLSLGNAEVPGNAGMKDQTMGLRWVRDNISVFGGDPKNVTIFGESAGAASVHYHVLSPLSKGLFHRAIIQSGCAYCPWAFSRDPVSQSKHLAQAAGCDPLILDDSEALLKWFREVPAMDLVKVLNKQGLSEGEMPVINMVPCAEPPLAGAFLLDEPEALIASGEVPRIPLIFGVTSHEGILFLPGSLLRLAAQAEELEKLRASPGAIEEREATMLAGIASGLENLLPKDLQIRKSKHQELCERIKNFYFNGKDISEETLEGLVHLNSDLQFSLGIMRAARDHARLGSRVYMYEFAFQGELNFLRKYVESKVEGAAHADDLGFQFKLPGFPEPQEGSPDAIVRRRMGRLWTNFAKSGNPSPVLDELVTTNWLPYTESDPNYLRIGENLEIDVGLWRDRMQFWVEMYRK